MIIIKTDYDCLAVTVHSLVTKVYPSPMFKREVLTLVSFPSFSFSFLIATRSTPVSFSLKKQSLRWKLNKIIYKILIDQQEPIICRVISIAIKPDSKCYVFAPKKLYKGTDEIIGFYPTNQNTLYLLHLFYSDNEIITECCRPAICTLIGLFKTSCLFISFNVVKLLAKAKELTPHP